MAHYYNARAVTRFSRSILRPTRGAADLSIIVVSRAFTDRCLRARRVCCCRRCARTIYIYIICCAHVSFSNCTLSIIYDLFTATCAVRTCVFTARVRVGLYIYIYMYIYDAVFTSTRTRPGVVFYIFSRWTLLNGLSLGLPIGKNANEPGS